MSRLKTPQQKKKESYAHDRVEGGEYPHADRKNRPRVKARGQREFRRTAKQLLTSQPEAVLQLPQVRIRRTWLKRGVPLPKHLEATQRHRIEREAWNLFRKGYGPATHARFRRVLQSWMQGNTEQSSSLAEFYFGILNQFPDELPGQEWYALHRGFLRNFFSSEPELKRDFQNWIAVVKKQPYPDKS
jgi:hypothetical protein